MLSARGGTPGDARPRRHSHPTPGPRAALQWETFLLDKVSAFLGAGTRIGWQFYVAGIGFWVVVATLFTLGRSTGGDAGKLAIGMLTLVSAAFCGFQLIFGVFGIPVVGLELYWSQVRRHLWWWWWWYCC